MNYPEELKLRYDEVMYDERDIIEKFLKDQRDLRYGHQRDTWHFEPAIEMITYHGSTVELTDIELDKDCCVKFIVDAYLEKGVVWECIDFAYGELSKVIEALPDVSEISKKNAINDLKVMTMNISIDQVLFENPFNYEVNGKHCIVDDVKCVNGTVSLVQALGNDTQASELSAKVLTELRDHINISVLHENNEYKKLVKFLSEQPNLYFEPAYCCHDTNVNVDVLSASLDSNGKLQLCVGDDEKRTIYLEEKDIRPEYLVELVGYIEDHCYCDIIDTSDGHRMAFIVYSIAQRDYPECEKKFNCDMGDFLALIIDDCDFESIHKVLQEICDDIDLQTILLFIRYK